MKEAHVSYTGMDLDYKMASKLASDIAERDKELSEPVMVAWHDKKLSRMSPVIEGGNIETRWHDYGESHGGRLEVDVNCEYDFIFADSSDFEKYGPSPYINLHDKQGNEFLCQINALRDPHNPSKEACVPLDDWFSKQT